MPDPPNTEDSVDIRGSLGPSGTRSLRELRRSSRRASQRIAVSAAVEGGRPDRTQRTAIRTVKIVRVREALDKIQLLLKARAHVGA